MATRAASAGPRILLRRLRETMAEPGNADMRLASTVRIIAANMVAEVCSIYLMRPDEVLELFATEGLNPQAVHRTRLKVGEGLVGDIARHARPQALAEAQSHPKFAYRPETGEEIYQSLLGVPILHGGKVLGVLVVQNRRRRNYTEEEIEALETIAMVLAELFASGQIVPPADLEAARRAAALPQRFEGRALAEGLGIGVAVLHEPRFVIAKTMAEDTTLEKERLERAFASMRDAIDRMLASAQAGLGGESRDILEAYKMFANDAGWVGKLREAVESGLTAEAAVQRVQIDTRNRMNAISDPYLRERLADLEDLANRLLLHLSNGDGARSAAVLPDDAIVLARDMGPAELLDYDRAKIKALVLEQGSDTSHVAIVARALDLPMIGGCAGIVAAAEPGDRVIVDAEHGQIFLRPGEAVLNAFRQSMAVRAVRLAKYAAQRDAPSITLDGVRIGLSINAGLLIDMKHLDETGADGIGLFRTELQFMVRDSFPKTEALAEIYTRVLDLARDRPVVFRTLDIGGDKVLPYLGNIAEENPAMGWRAIRISLDRPGLLKRQLRAMLQAAAGRRLDVMFPMIAEVNEFVRARAVLDVEIARRRGRGKPLPVAIRVGSMLEVPALGWQLPALAPLVDFISVGSNDLIQFLFAADRDNLKLAERYDPLCPSVLSYVRWVARQCDEHDVPLTLCGEMASRPLEAMAVLGTGIRHISTAAASVGPVKEMLRSLNLKQLEAAMAPLYLLPDHSVRRQLQNFARDYGVIVG